MNSERKRRIREDRRWMKKAERQIRSAIRKAGYDPDKDFYYLQSFEPEGFIKTESPTAEITIIKDSNATC